MEFLLRNRIDKLKFVPVTHSPANNKMFLSPALAELFS